MRTLKPKKFSGLKNYGKNPSALRIARADYKATKRYFIYKYQAYSYFIH